MVTVKVHIGRFRFVPERAYFLFGSLLTLFFVHCIAPSMGVAAPQRMVSESRAYTAATARLRTAQFSDPSARDLRRWEDAAIPLTQFLNDFPESPHAPEAYLSLGNLFQKLYVERRYKIAESRATFFYEKLIKRFPRHQLAGEAQKRLKELGEVVPVSRAQLKNTPPKTARPTASRAQVVQQSSAPREKAKEPIRELVQPEEPIALEPHIDEPVPQKSQELILNEPIIRRPIVVIDPGHGGEDFGARGSDGIFEKDVVLTVAKLLDELVRDRLRARTVLTRSTDVFIPLPDRTKIANDKNADLFVSVHANASELKNASGIETYYLDNTRDKASLKLAERENASMNLKGQGDVGFMLSDLIQNVKLEDSISLAHHVQRAMTGTLGQYYQGVHDLGVKKAPFYVLVGAHMPCILAEISFIDHPLEGKRLSDTRYQRLLAQALYEGIRGFFERRERPAS